MGDERDEGDEQDEEEEGDEDKRRVWSSCATDETVTRVLWNPA